MKRALLLLLVLGACGDDADYFTEEEIMDPEACMDCHPSHYREWSGSMHAYAADDPVFLAMNQRGQEETNGELGDFCVQCHAPMALRLGLTTDGTNLADVPRYAKGVTCYFCHSIDSVDEDHNAGVTLADDQVLRGGIRNPVASPKHRSSYSELIDSDAQPSSAACGGCHDVVTPAGVHLEKTFAEWEETIFATGEPQSQLSCGQCHMSPRPGAVAEADGLDVPLREVRSHTFASVDVALTEWPEKEAQLEALNLTQKTAITPRICVTPLEGGTLSLRLDNVGAGHMYPSGVAHDRRVWAEVHVYDAQDAELFATGVVPDGVDPEAIGDANLWEMREQAFDEAGEPALFFWDVRTTDESWLLRPTVTLDRNDPRFDHSTTRSWPVVGFLQDIARVTAAVHIRPIPFALIDELEASGHLGAAEAAAIRAQVPTHTLEGTLLEWRPELADDGGCVNP
jgi:hypothetical protein